MHCDSPLERLRGQLLTSLGLTSALAAFGCGSSEPLEDEGAAVTTDPSGDGSSVDDEAESSSSASTSEDGSDDATKLDLPPGSCDVIYSGFTPMYDPPGCDLPSTGPNGCDNEFYYACVDAQPGQDCASLCDSYVCPGCEGQVPVNGVCGPFEWNGQCCSMYVLELGCNEEEVEGRPFVVDGVQRFAALERSGASVAEPELPASVRERLAAHWARVAQGEHASIASFAQFGSRLLAIAAPAELIRDAFAAAGDEVRHTEVALALAARYGGEALGFGPLDVRGAADGVEDLEQLVLACVREGCIGETLAALELASAAACCDDPELAQLLRGIAQDETRHAALAWRVVQWGLARDPSLRPKVAELFASLRARPVELESLDAKSRRSLRAHGCLPLDERRLIERQGVRELILPCAAALLRGGSLCESSCSAMA